MVGAYRFHHFDKPSPQHLHQGAMLHDGQPRCETGGRRRSMEQPIADLLFARIAAALFRTGEMKSLPTQRALLREDREGAERVTTMHGQRMIQHVQDAQRSMCVHCRRGILQHGG